MGNPGSPQLQTVVSTPTPTSISESPCATQSRTVAATPILPSSISNPHRFGSTAPSSARKRSRSSTGAPRTWSRNIVCIPPEESEGNVCVLIPRGYKRARLAERGLIGKLSLQSTWNEREVEQEVSSVFRSAFNLSADEILPYKYLTTQPGTKRLMTSNVSTSFIWNAREVMSNVGQGALYIASDIKTSSSLYHIPAEMSSDDDDFEPTRQFNRNRSMRTRRRPMMLHELATSSLFQGEEGRSIPTSSLSSLHKREYFFAGQMCGMILCQGGPPPKFLSPLILEYIKNNCRGEDCNPSVIEVARISSAEILDTLEENDSEEHTATA
ncbi:PREDICTED: uncharacterized protein LOC106819861 [Priapulus caudatus]|uniref:Uncharacterized protein LOC106819861 n=1 Tax=Priapulus caudatus TaxID=37621 RepID=A0ABM1F648_PRICU|nr:PREDICTED: uncharacterized protein LOC106819861 [Priapulus caudatus]